MFEVAASIVNKIYDIAICYSRKKENIEIHANFLNFSIIEDFIPKLLNAKRSE